MSLILAEQLTKKFGKFIAVDAISFQVEQGQIFGFLGANGAGKTTAIRMMCGLLIPTSGSLAVAGIDVKKNPEGVRMHLGYMSQFFSMYPDLTVTENLRFYGTIYGMNEQLLQERIAEALNDLELEPFKDTFAGTLPLGFKQRLGLASATLHRPEIIFLDEPTSGVDPIARVKFWAYVQTMVKLHNMTALVTTHFLNEAEYCDYILLMHNGKIATQGTPAQMKSEVAHQIKIFQFETSERLNRLNTAKSLPYITDIYSWGRNFRIMITREGNRDCTALMGDLQMLGLKVSCMQEIQPTLEDVFIRYYSHDT
jgi:drug efflux transport system ATP-binding protein